MNSQGNTSLSIITIVLLIVAIAASYWAGMQPEKMEELKVGGAENRATLKTIMKSDDYKEQYAQSLDIMMQQISGSFDLDTSEFEGNDNDNIELTIDENLGNSGEEMDETLTSNDSDTDENLTINDIDEDNGTEDNA